MFNFHSVNTLEINGGPQAPEAPVLSIDAGEDINSLTWNSPYFTDFFRIYWSSDPFSSIDEPGVHTIDDPAIPGSDPSIQVSYSHTIPAFYSLSVLYYRVLAYNANGSALSNQVDSYNFRLAIYEALYNKTLDELTLRFTPELRRQYQDSILWRSFVQSLCSELAQSRFEIKEALKQLNLQKAVDVFLNMWNNITGISRINVDVPGSTTGEITPETDAQYRQRLIDNIFWDKISNLALKKTLLLRLGYDADVVDQGLNPEFFREIPELSAVKYQASFGNRFIPYAVDPTIELRFDRTGPDSKAEVDITGSTGTELLAGVLDYVNYDYEFEGTVLWPCELIIQSKIVGPRVLFISAVPSEQPPGSDQGSGSINHGPITLYNAGGEGTGSQGDFLSFSPSGATGTLVSSESGVLTFTLAEDSALPQKYDWVSNYPKAANWILTSSSSVVTSGNITVRPKLLSNIYSVNLGVRSLSDDELDVIYNEISPLAALGNVLLEILQDVILDFNDWDTGLGNIPYGAIFFGDVTQSGLKSTASNWSVGEEVIVDNQRTMGTNPPDYGDTFYGNDEPDDIIILKRTI